MSFTVQIADFCGSLRPSGYRITTGRQAVIEVLFEATSYVMALDPVQVVQKRAPGVGWISAYASFDLLMPRGSVQSSTLGRAATTYVLTPNKHHHMVCIEGRKTVDFDDNVSRVPQMRLNESLGRVLSRRTPCEGAGH